MFGAIGRWLKALMYLVTGQVDSARRTLDANPHVVRAKYDEIIRDKTSRIHQYKQAVAQIIAQEQQKIAKLRGLGDEIGRLEKLKAGALAKAKQVTERLKSEGKSPDQIKADEDYKRCLTAFNDFTSTLKEKNARVEELEQDVEGYRKTITDHKVQLEGLRRDLEKVKSESSETVADMITAKQEQEIADTLSGIAQDGTAEELNRLRTLRNEVRAEVQISKELAGTDHKRTEEEFLAYAMSSESTTEFDALIGLAESTETAAPSAESSEKTGLPE